MDGVGPMVGGLLAFWGSPCLIDSVPATWVAQLVLSSLFFFRLPGQCQYLGLPVADYFKQWINLKKVLYLSPCPRVLRFSRASDAIPLACFPHFCSFHLVVLSSFLFSILLPPP